MPRLVLATRGSKLALTQSQWVADQLMSAPGALEVELLVVKTRGDDAPDAPIPSLGDKGLFTREIEEALLDGRADLAVHSLKDLPIEGPAGLVVAAYPEREDPRDVLVSRSGAGLDQLPQGALVGTSSLRRSAQLAHYRPDLTFAEIRGNVDTRLRKLDEGLYDAILLAGAGLTRLGLRDRVTEWLPTSICLPAPGQGILGVQVRDGDDVTCAIVASLSSDDSRVCATAERAALEALGGGCRTPAAFLATLDGDQCTMEGVIVHTSGQPYYRGKVAGHRSEAAALGQRLGESLLADGAAAIIA